MSAAVAASVGRCSLRFVPEQTAIFVLWATFSPAEISRDSGKEEGENDLGHWSLSLLAS